MRTDVDAAYIPLRKGEVAETREFADGAAFADYDADGRVLGIEVIAPVGPGVFIEILGE